ncbi:MAG: YfiR family protein [bacterium]|nr:YfiR family protein [bacterium]
MTIGDIFFRFMYLKGKGLSPIGNSERAYIRMKKIQICLVLLMLSISLAAVEAEPAMVRLLVKIISIDRNFERYGDPIHIATDSDKMYDAMKHEFKTLKAKRRSLTVSKIKNELGDAQILYITKLKKNADILDTAKNKCLIFGNSEELLECGGGVVLVVTKKNRKNKLKMKLSLRNVRAQGANFPARFLKLATVIDIPDSMTQTGSNGDKSD